MTRIGWVTIPKHVALRRPMLSGQSHWNLCIWTKEGGRNWKGYVIDLLVTAATKSKRWMQNATVKMPGCNKLRSVCALDTTGPVSIDSGEQSAGATTRRREPSCPPRGKTEGDMEKDAKDVLESATPCLDAHDVILRRDGGIQ
jgi:hypothetical protein